jgi:hypothetical protein
VYAACIFIFNLKQGVNMPGVNMPGVLLPRDVLQQDGCIIDNQQDHIVMTVRLPKSMIRENYRLLVALTEAAGGTVEVPAPQSAAPVPAFSKTWFYAALVVIAIVIPSPIFQGNNIFVQSATAAAADIPAKKNVAKVRAPLGFFAPPSYY